MHLCWSFELLNYASSRLSELARQFLHADYSGYCIAGGRLSILGAAGEIWASPPLADLDNLTLLIALLRERRPG